MADLAQTTRSSGGAFLVLETVRADSKQVISLNLFMVFRRETEERIDVVIEGPEVPGGIAVLVVGFFFRAVLQLNLGVGCNRFSVGDRR